MYDTRKSPLKIDLNIELLMAIFFNNSKISRQKTLAVMKLSKNLGVLLRARDVFRISLNI